MEAHIISQESGIICWGHTCAMHVTPAHITEGKNFGYFLGGFE